MSRKTLSLAIYSLYSEVVNYWVRLNTILVRMLVTKFFYTITSRYT